MGKTGKDNEGREGIMGGKLLSFLLGMGYVMEIPLGKEGRPVGWEREGGSEENGREGSEQREGRSGISGRVR